MDLLKFLTREEPIAGLEISDSYIRLALLSVREEKEKGKKERKKITEIKFLKEKSLQEGVVIGGEVKNKTAFIKTLADFLKETKPAVKYAVVSILSSNIYSRIYSFPKSVTGDKLEDSMNLAIGFQLPVKPEDVYLDWEKIDGEKNEIFLATIPKPIINDYLEALTAAGLRTVAVEFYPMSISRAIDVPAEGAFLMVAANKEESCVFVLDGNSIKLNRFVPAEFLENEMGKIIDFYEAENNVSVSGIINIEKEKEKIKIISPFSENEEIKKDGSKWIIALGAAIRGIMPRSSDIIVSLMPVGTEEAYDNQKAITFSEFISNITIGLAVFFSAAFIGVWIMMISLQQNFSNRLSILDSRPAQGAGDLESRAMAFNDLTGKANSILGKLPRWSIALEELKSRVAPGILINSFSSSLPADAINMAGTAQTRPQLNLFKKTLEESPMFMEIKLPLTNLEQKENIPFSVSFRLKDPNVLIAY